MAIEIQPGAGRMQPVSGGPESARPWWMKPGVHTGIIGGIIGYLLGHWLGNALSYDYAQNALSDTNDVPIVLGYLLGVVGWLAGLGIFNDLGRLMLGKPLRDIEHAPAGGLAKYFRYTLDHKVVGIQYLFGMITYFLTGGLFAMAIRSELLSPTYHLMSSSAYLMVVGEHGTMMMMMMSSVVLGPFGQYFAPLMIGSKRMAFPRIEAIGFWLTPAAYVILLSGILLGGFPTGWTGYEPLATQAGPGMDTYAIAFGLMGISMILAGFNIIVTYINYRAPGMRWSRLPMFVWSMFTVSFLQVLAVPVLVAGLYMMITDRTFQTAFFANQLGGSSYLYQNVFWFFGHPEVYILALPGFGVVSEIIPVMCRKPLFGYRTAAAGMIGVALLSFFVWQHHLFDSGINPDMRPLFMLTTELISIPTGFIYLVALGTFWKAKIRFTVPMLFCLAMYFNFLIGGVSGRVPFRRARGHHRARVVLRHGPLPLHDHGRADLRLHGRYLLLAAQDDGDQAERTARQDPLLDHVHLLQLDLPAAVRPRHARPAAAGVRVRAEPAAAQHLGLDLRVLPGRIAADLPDQLRDVHAGLAREGSRQPVELPRAGMAGLLAATAGELRAHSGDSVRSVRVRRPGCAAGG